MQVVYVRLEWKVVSPLLHRIKCNKTLCQKFNSRKIPGDLKNDSNSRHLHRRAKVRNHLTYLIATQGYYLVKFRLVYEIIITALREKLKHHFLLKTTIKNSTIFYWFNAKRKQYVIQSQSCFFIPFSRIEAIR